jgi:hypothetical protein
MTDGKAPRQWHYRQEPPDSDGYQQWEIVAFDDADEHSGFDYIARIFTQADENLEEVYARRIANVPDMLEALGFIHAMAMEDIRLGRDGGTFIHQIEATARAVIDRVEWQSPIDYFPDLPF